MVPDSNSFNFKEHTLTNTIIHSLFLIHSYSFLFPFPVHSPGEDLVLIEPWRAFEVLDPGICRDEDRTSIVPLAMKEEEGSLIYEEEIVPNISTHAVRAMVDGIEDVCVVRRMLEILTHHPFDTDRIQINNKLINSFF